MAMSDKMKATLAREQDALAKLKEERTRLDERIRKSEAKIRNYEMMINDKKMSELAEVLAGSDLSVDDLFAALRKKDLIGLQEQMEATQQKKIIESDIMDDADEIV